MMMIQHMQHKSIQEISHLKSFNYLKQQSYNRCSRYIEKRKVFLSLIFLALAKCVCVCVCILN